LGEVSRIATHEITENTWLKGKLLPTDNYSDQKADWINYDGKNQKWESFKEFLARVSKASA
jgi:hypothetical protein